MDWWENSETTPGKALCLLGCSLRVLGLFSEVDPLQGSHSWLSDVFLEPIKSLREVMADVILAEVLGRVYP